MLARREPALAARAKYQQGVLYERLGRQPEAQQAYRAVLTQFASQAEIVALAKSKLTAGSSAGVVARKLWAQPSLQFSAVSPDGRFLAFYDGETGDLAVRDLASGEQRRLTNKGSWKESGDLAHSPVFSADGRQVAYAWFNQKEYVYDLRVVPFGGGQPRVVIHSPEIDYLEVVAWSRDGKNLLVAIQGRSGSNQIAWISAGDGTMQVLKTLSGWNYPFKLGLSPDGRFITYASRQKEDAPQNDIFVLAADGSRETALVHHPSDDSSPVWTPDGKDVVFASNRTGSRSLWRIAVADGRPRGAPQILRAGPQMNPLGFTRDGSLYYTVNNNLMEVYSAGLDPVSGKLVTAPAVVPERFVGQNSFPVWSADGQQLAYLSHRDGAFYGAGATTIVIRSMKTGEERDLPSRLDNRQLRWFPDGSALLVTVARQGKGLFRVDVKTGEAKMVIPTVDYVPDPEFSRDGKTIYYLHGIGDGGSKSVELRSFDVESRQEKVLLQVDWERYTLRHPRLSPDGRQVLFQMDEWKERRQELRVMPVEGGQPRTLLKAGDSELHGWTAPAWSADGKYVFYIRGRHELWRVPSQGGEPQKLDLAFMGLSFPDFDPSGSRIAFSAGHHGNVELWVMQNFLPDSGAAR